MVYSRLAVVLIIVAFTLPACKSRRPKTYTSACAAGIIYRPVSFSHLIDSAKFYDKQYVEVSGTYLEGKHISALVNDSTFTDHGNSHALWINFTQDCPLYLEGKNTGLFEAEDGEYNQINNKLVTIRGRVEIEKKGHLNAYRATINQVSYLRLN